MRLTEISPTEHWYKLSDPLTTRNVILFLISEGKYDETKICTPKSKTAIDPNVQNKIRTLFFFKTCLFNITSVPSCWLVFIRKRFFHLLGERQVIITLITCFYSY